jgi:putative transposase
MPGIVGSMGTVGDCYDNAAAESFFATLKTELLSRRSWATRAEATTAIFDYIEGFLQPSATSLEPRLPKPRRL